MKEPVPHRRKRLVVAAYVVVFWLLLPGVLLIPHVASVCSARIVLPLPAAWWFALVFAVPGVYLIIASSLNFVTAGRGYPISHLPPVRLVTNGPHAWMRHPIYCGYVLLWIGIAFALRSVSILVVTVPVLAASVAVYIAVEERVLLRRFGAMYAQYRRDVPATLLSGRPLLLAAAWLTAKLLFRFRVEGAGNRPAGGGYFVIAPHNNYLDPGFVALAAGLPIHFLTTHDMYRTRLLGEVFRRMGAIRVDRYRGAPGSLRKALRIVSRGGSVGCFPEGGRSWYGEGGVPHGLARLLAKRRIPVLPIQVRGGYQAWPRWNGLRRIRVTAHVLPPRVLTTPAELARTMASLRRRTFVTAPERATDASGLERILYLCIYCRAIGTIAPRGAHLVCRACGHRLTLTRRFALRDGETMLSLSDWHDQAVHVLTRRFEPVCCQTHWHTETGLERNDRIHGPATLCGGLAGVEAHSGSRRLSVAYSRVDAVLIRGRSTLQLLCNGSLETFRCTDERALLMQEWVRLRAFGDVFVRKRNDRVLVVGRDVFG